MKDHSLEELRVAAVEVLAASVNRSDGSWQYESLKQGLANHFAEKEPDQANQGQTFGYGREPSLSRSDKNLSLEVFWGLVRDGIICPGSDDSNCKFPWFRVTQWGRRYLEKGDAFPFHNGTSYVAVLRARVPNIDPSTLGYASEAASALEAGCTLAAGLTLCCALEHALS